MHAGEERRGSLRLLSMRRRSTTRFDDRRRVIDRRQVIDRTSRSGELRVKEALHISRDVAELLGFYSQGFVHEATPTTIGLGVS